MRRRELLSIPPPFDRAPQLAFFMPPRMRLWSL
jgi:hypothetical protein